MREPAASLRAAVASDSDMVTSSNTCRDFILAMTLSLKSKGCKSAK